MGKMTVPSKAELKDHIAKLEEENARLRLELESERMAGWMEKLPEAWNEFARRSEEVFQNTVRLVMFDHVDIAGYWFTFELAQDSRRQTYCVRHEELEGRA